MHDYYQILNIPSTATPLEIKSAYHTLLLKHHPDKQKHDNASKNTLLHFPSNYENTHVSPSSHPQTSSSEFFDIALLKEAYTTLSSTPSRLSYDFLLENHRSQLDLKSTGTSPRPAQIISLEDFTPIVKSADQEDGWKYSCRCGGEYIISELDMDKGRHLVGCDSCSEVIWVGYELADGNDRSIKDAHEGEV